MGIFKAYDIRGVVPDDFNAAAARRIGFATARFLAAPSLVVGRDARRTSPELAAALIDGITAAGVSVLDVELTSTPMLYFAVEHLAAGGGIMTTASHNPPQYNGFKVCREHAIPVGEETGLRDIEVLASEDPPANPERRGRVEPAQVRSKYVTHVLSVGGRCPALQVAIDCGNGMAAVGLEPVLERLPLRVERLYFEPDGTFPNHEADPLKEENLRDLQQTVRRVGADFGVAFDGDADRAVFVDENARPVPSDLITALLSAAVLRRHPGARVLYDLRSSRAVPEAIREAGGVPQMWRVGHSFIKARMRETGAVFAGELSGHFYFRFSDQLVADDGVAALVALLDLLDAEKRPLSELVAPLRRYAPSGEINRRVRDIPGLLTAIEAEHRAAQEISHLDGLLVRYEDWWFNLRPSNTEPVVRLNLEAATPEEMVFHRDELLRRVEELGGG